MSMRTLGGGHMPGLDRASARRYVVNEAGVRLIASPQFRCIPLWLLPATAIVLLALGLALGLLSDSNIALLLLAMIGIAVLNVVLLRQDEFTAVVVIAIAVIVDWYRLPPLSVHLPIAATTVALLLVGIIFLTQSPERPWIHVPHLPLWGLLLFLMLLPMFRGVSLPESIWYYVGTVFNAFLLYIIGVQVARNASRVHRLFSFLSGFGTVVAIHALIQVWTGVFLFASPIWNNYLAFVGDYTLAGSQTIRIGSFLINPDLSGAFLAVMVFIPVGLFLATSSRLVKAIYASEAILILLALLFTYSTASWLAVGVGLLVFLLLLGRGHRRFYLVVLVLAGLVAASIFFVFPSQIRLLTRHASAPQEWSLREGAWETGLQVIKAHPLTGVGLGLTSYLERAEPYRVPLQYRPLTHPHDSFLEIAALAGLPSLAAYLAVLLSALRLVIQNYKKADRRQRALFEGAIAALAVLTVNALASNAWTALPLVPIPWLILGALSSPALAQALASGKAVDGERAYAAPSAMPDMLLAREG